MVTAENITLKISQETLSVFVLYKHVVIAASSKHTEKGPSYQETWMQLTKAAIISFVKQQKILPSMPVTPLLPILFRHRQTITSWLIPETLIEEPCAAPLVPLDCIAPKTYIFTTKGVMPWAVKLGLPLNLNYAKYLALLEDIVRTTLTSDHDLVNNIDFTHMQHILSLF